jgi:prolyl oligopeptidase
MNQQCRSRSLLSFVTTRCIVVLALLSLAANAQKIPSPPPTAASQVSDTIHGVQVADPYRWLEDSASNATKQWIAAQQEYTKSLLTSRPAMASLRSEVRAFADIEQAQRCIYRNGKYFVLKREPGHPIAALYMREGVSGADKVLIDPAAWSADHSDTVDLLNVSQDGTLVAYGVRHGGRDQLSIHFFDVAAGRDLPDVLPEARYIYWAFPIAPDGSRAFYIRFEDKGPRICEHRMGQPAASDRVLFGNDLTPDKIALIHLSADGKLLLIEVLHGASGSSDVYAKPLDPEGEARTIVKDVDANFTAQSAGGKIYVLTNWKTPRGRVVAVDPADPDSAHWHTVVPEGQGTIQSFELAGGRILVNELTNAHSELRVFSVDGRQTDSIALPGLGSVSAIDADWDSPMVCFPYTSFQVPVTYISYSLDTRAIATISKPAPLPQLADIVVEQVWYRSSDGTRVPMFLAHRKDLKKDGKQPVLLYGYGGFNWAQLPEFSPEVATWLAHGGVYAVANIRGGNEFGEAWHRSGELDKKQNSFDDFIAAAQWLVDNHYTNPSRLAIQGLSNGGLLVTACITQRPDLFAAAIGRYPLIDMVRYERFSIARWWTSEYGSASDPAQFKWLYSYSPYHHVKKGTAYPAVLLITGDGDTRVDPSHARKMTAILQSATSSGKPVLLLYDSKSGHSSSLSTSAEVEQTSHELAFLFWQLGVAP